MGALKWIEKIIAKKLLNKGIKKPGWKFNPGEGLISLRTTRPWAVVAEVRGSCHGFGSPYGLPDLKLKPLATLPSMFPHYMQSFYYWNY